MYLIFQIKDNLCYRTCSIHFIKNPFDHMYLVSNNHEVVCPQILNTDRNLADGLSSIRVEKNLGNGFPWSVDLFHSLKNLFYWLSNYTYLLSNIHVCIQSNFGAAIKGKECLQNFKPVLFPSRCWQALWRSCRSTVVWRQWHHPPSHDLSLEKLVQKSHL